MTSSPFLKAVAQLESDGSSISIEKCSDILYNSAVIMDLSAYAYSAPASKPCVPACLDLLSLLPKAFPPSALSLCEPVATILAQNYDHSLLSTIVSLMQQKHLAQASRSILMAFIPKLPSQYQTSFFSDVPTLCHKLCKSSHQRACIQALEHATTCVPHLSESQREEMIKIGLKVFQSLMSSSSYTVMKKCEKQQLTCVVLQLLSSASSAASSTVPVKTTTTTSFSPEHVLYITSKVYHALVMSSVEREAIRGHPPSMVLDALSPTPLLGSHDMIHAFGKMIGILVGNYIVTRNYRANNASQSASTNHHLSLSDDEDENPQASKSSTSETSLSSSLPMKAMMGKGLVGGFPVVTGSRKKTGSVPMLEHLITPANVETAMDYLYDLISKAFRSDLELLSAAVQSFLVVIKQHHLMLENAAQWWKCFQRLLPYAVDQRSVFYIARAWHQLMLETHFSEAMLQSFVTACLVQISCEDSDDHARVQNPYQLSLLFVTVEKLVQRLHENCPQIQDIEQLGQMFLHHEKHMVRYQTSSILATCTHIFPWSATFLITSALGELKACFTSIMDSATPTNSHMYGVHGWALSISRMVQQSMGHTSQILLEKVQSFATTLLSLPSDIPFGIRLTSVRAGWKLWTGIILGHSNLMSDPVSCSTLNMNKSKWCMDILNTLMPIFIQEIKHQPLQTSKTTKQKIRNWVELEAAFLTLRTFLCTFNEEVNQLDGFREQIVELLHQELVNVTINGTEPLLEPSTPKYSLQMMLIECFALLPCSLYPDTYSLLLETISAILTNSRSSSKNPTTTWFALHLKPEDQVLSTGYPTMFDSKSILSFQYLSDLERDSAWVISSSSSLQQPFTSSIHMMQRLVDISIYCIGHLFSHLPIEMRQRCLHQLANGFSSNFASDNEDINLNEAIIAERTRHHNIAAGIHSIVIFYHHHHPKNKIRSASVELPRKDRLLNQKKKETTQKMLQNMEELTMLRSLILECSCHSDPILRRIGAQMAVFIINSPTSVSRASFCSPSSSFHEENPEIYQHWIRPLENQLDEDQNVGAAFTLAKIKQQLGSCLSWNHTSAFLHRIEQLSPENPLKSRVNTASSNREAAEQESNYHWMLHSWQILFESHMSMSTTGSGDVNDMLMTTISLVEASLSLTHAISWTSRLVLAEILNTVSSTLGPDLESYLERFDMFWSMLLFRRNDECSQFDKDVQQIVPAQQPSFRIMATQSEEQQLVELEYWIYREKVILFFNRNITCSILMNKSQQQILQLLIQSRASPCSRIRIQICSCLRLLVHQEQQQCQLQRTSSGSISSTETMMKTKMDMALQLISELEEVVWNGKVAVGIISVINSLLFPERSVQSNLQQDEEDAYYDQMVQWMLFLRQIVISKDEFKWQIKYQTLLWIQEILQSFKFSSSSSSSPHFNLTRAREMYAKHPDQQHFFLIQHVNELVSLACSSTYLASCEGKIGLGKIQKLGIEILDIFLNLLERSVDPDTTMHSHNHGESIRFSILTQYQAQFSSALRQCCNASSGISPPVYAAACLFVTRYILSDELIQDPVTCRRLLKFIVNLPPSIQSYLYVFNNEDEVHQLKQVQSGCLARIYSASRYCHNQHQHSPKQSALQESFQGQHMDALKSQWHTWLLAFIQNHEVPMHDILTMKLWSWTLQAYADIDSSLVHTFSSQVLQSQVRHEYFDNHGQKEQYYEETFLNIIRALLETMTNVSDDDIHASFGLMFRFLAQQKNPEFQEKILHELEIHLSSRSKPDQVAAFQFSSAQSSIFFVPFQQYVVQQLSSQDQGPASCSKLQLLAIQLCQYGVSSGCRLEVLDWFITHIIPFFQTTSVSTPQNSAIVQVVEQMLISSSRQLKVAEDTAATFLPSLQVWMKERYHMKELQLIQPILSWLFQQENQQLFPFHADFVSYLHDHLHAFSVKVPVKDTDEKGLWTQLMLPLLSSSSSSHRVVQFYLKELWAHSLAGTNVHAQRCLSQMVYQELVIEHPTSTTPILEAYFEFLFPWMIKTFTQYENETNHPQCWFISTLLVYVQAHSAEFKSTLKQLPEFGQQKLEQMVRIAIQEQKKNQYTLKQHSKIGKAKKKKSFTPFQAPSSS